MQWASSRFFGGGLGFTLASFMGNAIFPWFRYYIVVIPMAVLLVGSMFAKPVKLRPQTDAAVPSKRWTNGALWSFVATLTAIVLLAPSLPSTGIAMTNLVIAPDVVESTGYFFFPKKPLDQTALKFQILLCPNPKRCSVPRTYASTNRRPRRRQRNKCVPFLVTNMTEPRVFVIHNDRDFQRVLADPLTFHAHYLLVGLGINNDAILDQYPNVGTASWVKLVHTFKFPTGDFCDGYRLFHVVGHPTQSP